MKLLRFAAYFLLASVLTGTILGISFVHPLRRLVTEEDERAARGVGKVTPVAISPVSGWLISHASPRRPTIVLTHGRSQNRMQVFPLAKAVFARGYNVLLWDLPHHGNSGGSTTYGPDEIASLLRVVDWARAHPDVDRDAVSAIGFSLGAGMSIGAAASDRECRIRSVVADSPYSSVAETGEWYARVFGVIPKPIAWPTAAVSLRVGSLLAGIDVQSLSPRDWAARVQAPVFIVQPGNEWSVKPESASEIFERLGSRKELWVVPGVRHVHAFQGYPQEYTERVTRFIESSTCVPRI